MTDLIQRLDHRFQDYLRDESRLTGTAESISFPRSEADVQEIVRTLAPAAVSMTIQGGRTGLVGGAVPAGGHILNLSALQRVTGMEMDQAGQFGLWVQPGLSLLEVSQLLSTGRFDTTDWNPSSRQALDRFQKSDRHFFWPPDPTETTATIGGMASTDARGVCAGHYGLTARHIDAIRLIDAGGQTHILQRGQYTASPTGCPLPGGGYLPIRPEFIENSPDIDLIDLFLGSEGILGAISGLRLRIQPRPAVMWGIIFFFDAPSPAVEFVETVLAGPVIGSDESHHLVALEYLDQTTLACIDQYRSLNSRLRVLPPVDPAVSAAVLIELHGHRPDPIENMAAGLLEKAINAGGDPDANWAFSGEAETANLRLFRHAAPASINALIDRARQTDPRLHKLGTDIQPAKTGFTETLTLYQNDLHQAGLKAAIFGHAGDTHLHVNILPENYQQLIEGRELIRDWARRLCPEGGNPATEHVIGRLKGYLFESKPMPPSRQCLIDLKRHLDPDGIWNPAHALSRIAAKLPTDDK